MQKEIEERSPQIIGHDAEIWLELVKRDVPNWQEKPHQPKNPANWYKVYRKLIKESELEVKKDAALLKATLDCINKEKSQHKLQRVELASVKPIKGMQRTDPIIKLGKRLQMRQGISGSTISGPFLSSPSMKARSGLEDVDPSKASKASKGRLDRILKGAPGMSHFNHQQRPPPETMTRRDMALKSKPTANTIIKAPRQMIEEHQLAAAPKPVDPSTQHSAAIESRKRKIEHVRGTTPNVSAIEERENRLRAFTNPSNIRNRSPLVKPPRSRISDPTILPSATSTRESSSKPHVGGNESSSTILPSNGHPHGSLAPGHRVPQAQTSSPSNGGVRTPLRMKEKAPVDIFMRPNKRPRLAS